MRLTTAIITLMLSLTLLMTLPGTYTNVRAVNQNGLTRWSPFGPASSTLLITYYSDFTTMFNAFTSGQIDMSDWPTQPGNLGPGGFCDTAANPDFFCTTPTTEFGIFELGINSDPAVMGVALHSARTTLAASATVGASTAACSTGFGSLTVTLENQEASNAVIQDQFNTVNAANQPSGLPSYSASDSGGATPNGIYQLGSGTSCLLAGNYLLSTSIYGGSVNPVVVTSGSNTAITFKVNWNSVSNVSPTAARAYWGHALGHMIDKSAWVTDFFKGSAGPVDTFASPAQGLTQPTTAQLTSYTCAPFGVNIHTWASQCTGGSVVGEDNLVADSITASSTWYASAGQAIAVGLGYSGQADLRAACDDLNLMGFAISPSGATCNDVANALTAGTAQCTAAPCTYAHLVPTGNVVYYIRTNLGRKFWGTVIADSMNALFGTPSNVGGGTVCYGACPQFTPKYYTITQVTPIVFHDGIAGNHDGWQLYTEGYSLTPTPDHLYGLLNSKFTGGVCQTGGAPTVQPGDYRFYCDPQFDTWSAAGEFSSGGAATTALFSRAADYAAQVESQVNIEVDIASFVELNGWNFQQCTGSPCAGTQSSIVNTLGQGTEIAYWDLLNARPVPGYNPCATPFTGCANFAPSGGVAGQIRHGFSQDTDNVSPFQAGTVWDAEVYSYIFDSMLALNPMTGGSNAQLLYWDIQNFATSFNANEVSCVGPNASTPTQVCATGTTTETWTLRSQINGKAITFQDGNTVTAADIAYSILSAELIPSNFSTGTSQVSSVTPVAGPGDPTAARTVQVKLQGASPFYELDIGGVPILEKALWAPFCNEAVAGGPDTGVPQPAGPCSDPTFDPMNPGAYANPAGGNQGNGIMVGTGPWVCKDITTGHIGGSCIQNADNSRGGGSATTGARILFSQNTKFPRCCASDTTGATNLYDLSWADFGDHNGLIDFLEITGAGGCFGLSSGQTRIVNGQTLCSAAGSTHWTDPNVVPGGTVGITTLTTLSLLLHQGTTAPFTASQLTGIDPQIDPQSCPITGC